MAASANTIDTLNGHFKQIYAEKLKNLVPDGVKLYNLIPFSPENKLQGNQYHQPVVLGLEHGITYGGPDGNAFILNAAVAGVSQDATVQGYEMVLRSALSIGAVQRSLGSEAAFTKTTKHLIANMVRSISRRLEVQLMYGAASIGRVSGVSSNIITISDATWAPGIWSGAENMLIDFYDDLPSNSGTLQLANAEIASVSFTDRTITLSSGGASVAANDYIFYKGAFGNEFNGIDRIVRNTGSLFGINAATYNLWQGSVLSNSGTPRQLSFELIAESVTKLVEKGLADQDVVVFVNPIQFDKLISDQTAKRSFDQSYNSSKYNEGSKTIEFFSQNGRIEIVPSIYIKAGSAYVICLDEFIRVGSSDITFDQPGFPGEFFRLLSDNHGYELRAYTDQALFCSAPGRNAIIDDLIAV